MARVSALNNRMKQRCFLPDAMECFEKESGFIQRQLTDNAYIARIARKYFDVFYGDGKSHVWSVTVL